MTQTMPGTPAVVIAEAWKEWIQSDEGRNCMVGGDQYLGNKLWVAFLAAFRAADKWRDQKAVGSG